MGVCCSGPPDLTEQNYEVKAWKELFGPGSTWIGKASLLNEETNYLEINVTSKQDEPLNGQRVLNIARGTTSQAERLEFVIEKVPKRKREKDEPLYTVVFYWEDSSGLTLKGTNLNPQKLKMSGNATLLDKDAKTELSGDFHLTRVMAPSNVATMISPRAGKSDSTQELFSEVTRLANKKYKTEEDKRLREIDARAQKAISRSSGQFEDELVQARGKRTPRKFNKKGKRNREESSV